MKLLYHILFVVICCYILELFLPWWSVAIGAFLVALILNNNCGVSFLGGFLGVGLLWLIMAFYLDNVSNAILSEKLNNLLPMNALALTTIVGGLTGGLASWAGAALRK